MGQSSIRLVGEPGHAPPTAVQNSLKSSAASVNASALSTDELPADLYNSMFTALTGDTQVPVSHDKVTDTAPPGDRSPARIMPPRAEPKAIEADVFSYRIVLNCEPRSPAVKSSPAIAATEPACSDVTADSTTTRIIGTMPTEQPDVFKSLLVAVNDEGLARKSQPAPQTHVEVAKTAPQDITPIDSEPPVAAAPGPVDTNNYRFAIRTDVQQPPRPQNIETEESVVAGSAPLALEPVKEPATIALAERAPRVASRGSSDRRAPAGLSRQNMPAGLPSVESPSRLVSSPAAPALEPQPAPRMYLSDAISATGTPCCDDHDLLPYGCPGCPYHPGQSGAHMICGVDCGPHGAACCEKWENARWIPWSMFGPGEYVGPPRPEHVPVYYLRVNDLITLTYIVSRQKQADQYRIGVGDRLRIESGFDESLERELSVQPDGDISLPLIGEVPAAGKTIKELREDLIRRFSRIEREPVITITPVEFNMGLREILNAVTSQSRLSGQAIDLRVTPEGTIQAPGLGSVYVQGLAIEELRSELEARYTAMFGPGLLVSPALSERATSYVFIGGEVVSPGRYTLEGPTTVMQAIALAGGWNNGGNTREVVVFRRDENWCLKATKINVHRPLYGKDPCPVNDVWLRDNDLVIVPKSKILCAADVIELYFTRGVYAVFPITFVKDFSQGSTMAVPIGP